MPLESGKELLLVLLFVPGPTGKPAEPIRGTTRIEKLTFLSKNYPTLKPFIDKFRYRADNFGPYSDKVPDDLEALRTLKLVEIREIPLSGEPAADEIVAGGGMVSITSPQIMREYRLTKAGEIVAQRLCQNAVEEAESLKAIKRRFNGVPLDTLLSFVYTTSDPKYLERSKIKERYL